ncbi:MAG: YciI family protein [Alphaproteobacteria bacterium]|nr:YciI family protein [Alphaproteobacteria bacterium]
MTDEEDSKELRKRFLAKKLWVIMTRRCVPVEEMQRHLGAHLRHQISLEKKGIMYGAGPCHAPAAPEPAFGLIIIRAADESEARRIADSDPMHVAGVRKYELFQWTMNEGQMRIALNFSDQTYQFE